MYKKVIFVLLILGVLTVLLAACGIRDISNTQTGPTVHMGGSVFLQDSITIKKGDSLTLIDDTTSPHVVVNGSWVNGAQQPKQESGAPTVNLNFKGNDSGTAGPFNTAGTYNLYCTLHGNMNLKVIVQ